MANQIIIDIGAAANDGTGDPLRTAFNYVNNNFSNVWNTGLPASNVQFLDNKILTVNTNANLVLAPNGIGKVASNVDIVPNTANVFALGSPTRRWNTVYGQYLDLSHNATIGGNLVVTGNLSAGNISYTSNVFVGDLEGSVFDGASSIVLDVIDSAIYVDNYRYANGTPVSFSGTPGGTNTQIQFNNAGSFGGSAAFTFNRTSNTLSVSGNIAAGNVFVTSTITSDECYIDNGTFTGDPSTGSGSLYVGSPTFTVLGTDIMAQFTGNVPGYGQLNLQNYSNSVVASGDYIITADNGNDTSHFLDMGMTSSTWDGSETNVLAGLVANNGYLYVQDGNLTVGTRNGNISYAWNFDTAGNLTVAGNVIPTGNNAASLGSPTHQWSDLYVSNATIYMNNVPLSLTAGNVLTINGEAVLSNDSATNITTTGNITAENITATGDANLGSLRLYASSITMNDDLWDYIQISPSGESWAYLQIPKDSVANVQDTRLHNDAGNIEFGTGQSSTSGPGYTWTLNNDGTMTVPGAITSATDTTITAEDDVNILGGDKLPVSDSGEGGDINITGGSGRIDNGVSAGSGGDVLVTGGLGGHGVSSGAGAGGGITLQAGEGGDANTGNAIQAGEGGQILIQGGSGGLNGGDNSLSGIGGNVEIYGGSGSFDNANTIPNGAPGHVNLYGGNWGFNFAPTGNIYLNTYDGTNFKTLAYDYNGNVTMAAGGGLNFVGSNPGIVQSPDEDFKIRVQDADDDDFSVYLQVDDGAGTVLGQTRLRRDQFVMSFADGVSTQFIFTELGEMQIPGNIRATEYVDTSLYAVSNDTNDGSVELKTISYSGDVLGSNVRVTQSDATISTNNSLYTWKFDNFGNLTLPLNGNLVGSTANNNGYINWAGNSSGDLNGYTTMRLIPDDTRENYDQYLIIDPTAPGHIHIRAGGTQDNSGADLILGGEDSYFRVSSGSSPNVYVRANSNNWTFDTTGNLNIPKNIHGLNNGAPLVIDAGTQGYSYVSIPSFTDGGETLNIVNNYTAPTGGINLTVNSKTWNFTSDGIGVLPNSVYGYSQFYTSGAANLYLGSSSYPINIVGSNGDLIVPGAISTTGNITGGNLITAGNISGNVNGYNIGYREIPQVTLSANANVALSDSGKHFYSTTAGNLQVTIPDNANVAFPTGATITIVVNAAGNVIVAQGTGVSLYMAGSSSTGNRAVGAYGLASVMKVATDTWVISGTGVY